MDKLEMLSTKNAAERRATGVAPLRFMVSHDDIHWNLFEQVQTFFTLFKVVRSPSSVKSPVTKTKSMLSVALIWAMLLADIQ